MVLPCEVLKVGRGKQHALRSAGPDGTDRKTLCRTYGYYVEPRINPDQRVFQGVVTCKACLKMLERADD